ncbi:LacI family DNA-binding transcriptional regulator [Leifsonia sp. AG29]|uniref:LacI family DNA-binding transcriptional regulator n=1 Tax=Leifsonia sp. AG29 TaxID=2598860 RepID=UPI00131D976B|nr:LacI family DNA-binding transcriptional regulator [Leifsonia sp. AG29]
MATTIYDVARHAGVSPRTVSNVVNGYVHVSDEMRTRVKRSIDALGYRPNLLARGLRSGKTGIITLALPELAVPYFSELSSAIITSLASRDYTVNVRQTDGSAEAERRLLREREHPRMFDGLIFSPLGISWEELSEAVHSSPQPMVLLGEQVEEGTVDHVFVDNVAASADATEHLLSLGRRRVAAIGSQPTAGNKTAELRVTGYRQALGSAGIRPDPRLIVDADVYHREAGFAAMRSLLDSGAVPDAVFCFNDLLAIGAMRAILLAGLRVPEDIAVVGFDGIDEGGFATPSLTTIAPDKGAIARLAVDRLLARIDGEELPASSIQAPYRLIVRESTNGRP